MLLVGCENPYFTNPHSEEGTETYQFDVSAVYLNTDSNGYFHMILNPSSNQTLSRLVAYTNNPNTQKVMWDADVYWIFNGDAVQVVNSDSYSDRTSGEAYTMFAPIYSMLGDTIRVYSWYYDEHNSNAYYNDYIDIVLD
jgi:hypothetical protein